MQFTDHNIKNLCIQNRVVTKVFNNIFASKYYTRVVYPRLLHEIVLQLYKFSKWFTRIIKTTTDVTIFRFNRFCNYAILEDKWIKYFHFHCAGLMNWRTNFLGGPHSNHLLETKYSHAGIMRLTLKNLCPRFKWTEWKWNGRIPWDNNNYCVFVQKTQ